MIVRHNNKEIERIVPISSHDNKECHIMTDILSPGSIKCITQYIKTSHGSDFLATKFSLTSFSGNDDHKKDDIDKIQSNIVIKNLNSFVEGLTKRLKFIMLIPQIHQKKSYILSLNTAKLNGHIIYKNIIEIDGHKNNLNLLSLKEILMNSSFRILLRINYLLITIKSVILNISLVRVFPISLASLSTTSRLGILGEINKTLINSVNKYNELACVADTSRISKKDASNEIIKLLRIPKSVDSKKI